MQRVQKNRKKYLKDKMNELTDQNKQNRNRINRADNKFYTIKTAFKFKLVLFRLKLTLHKVFLTICTRNISHDYEQQTKLLR